MNAKTTYKHWHMSVDDDKILWLVIDRAGAAVNSMNRELIEEFGRVLDEISANKAVKAVIIKSGKAKGFIAGADITQFTQLKTVDEAKDLVRQAQKVFDKLAGLKVPTVAMIDGFCLGGGAELALACRYRVAAEETTRIGLPEVKLGIHPGWGGTVRLPRLIGVMQAMPLILSGPALRGSVAARKGFVDKAVPQRQLARAARFYALNKPKRQQAGFIDNCLSLSLIRPLIGKQLTKKLKTKISKDHYPAPFAVVDNWVKAGARGEKAMLLEADSIARLFLHPTSRNLVRVFSLTERMKGLAKGIKFAPKHVHVIGAGTMGGDIAAWCALRGMRVTLQDREPKFIAPAIKRAYKLFKKKLKVGHLVQGAMDRLIPDVGSNGVPHADVVIEAIYENVEAKQALYKDLEKRMRKDALLATNTSSLPLDELNTILKDPSRLVGIHFFNPVAMMQLVEVVRGEKTSQAVVDQSIAFVRKIDRLPLPVKSAPGFVVNRTLVPYMLEAVKILEEGVSPVAIDKAAVKFGMPMGPVQLADTVGIDICLSVAETLLKAYGGEVPAVLKKMVADKHLGRKTGKGFYSYNKAGKLIKPQATEGKRPPADLTDRLILRMVNEGMAIVREGVIEDADLFDAGMIFGTGFAPFRGGPLHYAQTEGYENIVKRLNDLAKHHGDSYKPDEGFNKM